MKRLLSLVIAAYLLLALCPVSVRAEVIGHVLRDPQLLQGVEFPEHWSRDALVFCVGNGIIQGRDDGLAHLENTSRAETAAMLVRLLGGQNYTADLSGYEDADPDAWYYPEISAAVALGIMNGVSDTSLAPNDPVTREQVFTMFCRAFGVYAQDGQHWEGYTDGARISAYARNAISALAERGYIKGYPNGTILPNQLITRGELAQLIYGMFTHICSKPEELPAEGQVLYLGTDPIPQGYTLKGSLTLGSGLSGQINLEGVSISGELSLRCAPESKITMTGCLVNGLSAAGDLSVSSDTAVMKLFACGTNSLLELDAAQVWVGAGCTLNGSFETIHCTGSGLVLNLHGMATLVELWGDGITLNGQGFAEKIDVYGLFSVVTVPHGQQNDYSYSYDYENALNTVESLDVWDTVVMDTWLYSSSSLYGAIRALPAGTKLLHYYLHDGASAASVYTTDGQFGYVPVKCVQIPKEQDISSTDYSQATMEGFVDQMGYSSRTKYLIWVSLKTQTVNVFTGSTGDWTLVKTMPCASGLAATPTVKGSFRLHYRYNTWVFDGYKVRYVSGFYEGYAFHSVPYNNSFTQILDPTMGEPASHGCLRMWDADCKYIYDNIPYNTTVVVY